MSQSPTDPKDLKQASDYRRGWSAIHRLIHEGKSFSGHEKNCVFLNLAGNGFVDVSGLSGINFEDDARALVSCDWDFDGDKDLWITSRTSPRLRLLVNHSENSQPKSNFVSVWLKGDGNQISKDPFGSSIKLYLKNNSKPLTRLLQAGDAFLSQESRWLHFSFPKIEDIDYLEVCWPGGRKQKLQSIEENNFYVVEFNQKPTIWLPPKSRKELHISKQTPNSKESKSRIIPISRLPLPSVYTSIDGESSEILKSELKGPLLINLWATWCGPCHEELISLTSNKAKIRSNGLDIMALNVEEKDARKAGEILAKIKWPFEAGNATSQTVLNLDLFQRGLLDRWETMPVPSSFLVDKNGEVAVIYKGPVDSNQIIEDMALLEMNSNELRDKATPFTGRWVNNPKTANPSLVNSQFVAHNQIDEGINFLNNFIETKQQMGGIHPKQIGNLYFTIGSLQLDKGDFIEAEKSLRAAIREYPDEYRTYIRLGKLLLSQSSDSLSSLEEAINHFVKAAKLNPKDPTIRAEFASAMMLRAEVFKKSGDTQSVISTYKDIIKTVPTSIKAAENLAWVLLTAKDKKFININDAYGIASHLCKITDYRNADFLDLLSFAECKRGDFGKAMKHSQRAAIIHRQSEDSTKEAISMQRIRSYKRKEIPAL